MKIFYFKPRSYGREAFVLANNKEEAKESLSDKFHELLAIAGSEDSREHIEELGEKMLGEDGYIIEEGNIFFSEIS